MQDVVDKNAIVSDRIGTIASKRQFELTLRKAPSEIRCIGRIQIYNYFFGNRGA